MMLSSLPSARNDATRRHRPADLPLHERLFGDHSGLFYIWMSLWIGVTAALLAASVVYAPHRTPEAIGALALPIFFLIVESPSRRVQAVAMAIMGGLLWSHLVVGTALIAAAAVGTGLATYVCEAVIRRELARLPGLTGRQRLPNLARLVSATVVGWALVAIPGALIVYAHLLGWGWAAETAGYIVAGALVLLALIVCRKLADEIPGPADG